ncbi:MAG: hypothetical protein C0404_12745, partial [Verrucomicrobia bacterium]|nr:hypothetical protein [Verrucomicrobiota bacterium]
MKSIGHLLRASVFAATSLLLFCPAAGAANTDTVSATNVVVLDLTMPANYGIRPSTNATAEDLIDITLDDVPLQEVIRMFSKLSRMNIVVNPEYLHGNVTVNIVGIRATIALEAILDMNSLELVEKPFGSGVLVIRPKRGYDGLTDLFFMEQGNTAPTNRIHITVANAPLAEVLRQIARQAKINIRYETKLETQGNVTMDIADAEYLQLLRQITELQGLKLEKSPYFNAYIVGTTEPNTSQSPYQQVDEPYPAALAIGLVASLASIFGLLFALPAIIIRDAGKFAETGERKPWRSMVFWPFVLVLCIIYGWSIGTWLAWDTFFDSTGIEAGLVVSLATTAILFGLAILIVNVGRSIGWPRRRSQRILSWSIALIPIAVIMMDSSPIREDYKWEDLPRPAKDANESETCLRSLLEVQLARSPDCITGDCYFTNALQVASEIDSAWTNAAAATELVKQLGSFDGIDDPTAIETYDLFSGEEPNYVMKLRQLMRIYSAYAVLKTEEHQPEEAATRLVEFHTIVMKALPYSKPLVNKMVWLAMAGYNVRTAHRIARNPSCTPTALAVLKKGFPPLTQKDISLRWCFMTSYLSNRKAVQEDIDNARYIEALSLYKPFEIVSGGTAASGATTAPSGNAVSQWPPARHRSGFWERNLSRLAASCFFKRNRSTRDLRRYHDLLMAQCDQRPLFASPDVGFGIDYGNRPRLSNICGWLLVQYMADARYDKARATAAKTLVLSDLLAIELRTMCGEKTDIRDYYTGENYITNPKFG